MTGLLHGKSVLVTGAGKNIGRSIVVEMAREGAAVRFVEIDAGSARLLEEELAELPGRGRGFVADVSCQEGVESVCDGLAAEGTVVDVLVNNLGIQPPHREPVTDFDWMKWQRLFDTNVFGPLALTARIVGMMEQTGVAGSIIFITSIHQWIVRRYMSYSASKAALAMIVKELAVELAPKGIRVNGIAPGYVEGSTRNGTQPHRFTPLFQTSIPASYIGRSAVYLASDHFSRYTTGAILKVDAGLSLYNHLLAQEPLESTP